MLRFDRNGSLMNDSKVKALCRHRKRQDNEICRSYDEVGAMAYTLDLSSCNRQ